jgi:trimethylamine---corrinoid protein Co-methyltransferase
VSAKSVKENIMNNVRPHLTLLSYEQIRQVHQYTLRILSETGVRVDSENVLELLRKTGQVQIEGRIVRFSGEIIEQAIQSTPPVIQVYDRRGEPVFRLGDDRLRIIRSR